MEQPDLVFVEDLLPSINGVELTRRAGLLAPGSPVAAQVQGQADAPALLAAGARAAFVRHIPPAELAKGLLDMLHGSTAPRTVV